MCVCDINFAKFFIQNFLRKVEKDTWKAEFEIKQKFKNSFHPGATAFDQTNCVNTIIMSKNNDLIGNLTRVKMNKTETAYEYMKPQRPIS